MNEPRVEKHRKVRHHHKYKPGVKLIRRMYSVPEELDASLKKIAEGKHISINSVVVDALELWTRWYEDTK